MSSFVSRLRARPATLMVGLLAVLAMWEVGTLVNVHAGVASDDDWHAAAAYVSAAHNPDSDLVVFAPAWNDPIGRQWFGHLLDLDDLGRADAARYGRLWEISIRGESAPEVAGLALDETQAFGPVRVRRFSQTPATISWRVPALGQGEIHEVAHLPRRCQKMSGKREFRAVSLGSELVVHAGLADVWARKENRAHAKVRVAVDGSEVATASIGNDSGWTRLHATTTPGVHDVSIEIGVDPDRGDPKKPRLEVCVVAEGRTP